MLCAKSQPFIMATYTPVWLEMSKAGSKVPCKCISGFRPCQISMAGERDKRSGLPTIHLSAVPVSGRCEDADNVCRRKPLPPVGLQTTGDGGGSSFPTTLP